MVLRRTRLEGRRLPVKKVGGVDHWQTPFGAARVWEKGCFVAQNPSRGRADNLLIKKGQEVRPLIRTKTMGCGPCVQRSDPRPIHPLSLQVRMVTSDSRALSHELSLADRVYALDANYLKIAGCGTWKVHCYLVSLYSS